jgi:prophage regulatory protein
VSADVTPAAFDRKKAAAYLALSVRTFERLVREKSAPQPRQLAGRRVAWLRVELDQWLAARPVSEQLPPPNTGAPKPRMGHHGSIPSSGERRDRRTTHRPD